MVRTLPGTTIEVDESRFAQGSVILDSLFLAGGLTLAQVSQLTGLEPHMVQNWVKRGFLPPPRDRRYNKDQFCRLALINMLRGCLRLDQVTALLSYLNGSLAKESDDIIDDSALYAYVLRLALWAEGEPLASRGEWEARCREVLADYQGPYPEARDKVAQGLRVILTAYASNRLREVAQLLGRELWEGSETG